MNGLGATGAQQSKDCAFPAGSVSGAPLRISWFLVIFFVYQLIDAFNNNQQLPLWVRVVIVTGNEALLLLTVLCHEMGHGTMARKCGGEIAEVLLWPFGGICFTTRPQDRAPREKLVDDLWIVAAGPATHFPQAAVWLTAAVGMASMCSHVVLSPAWKNLIPFASPSNGCISLNTPGMGCFETYTGMLLYHFLVQAIQLNVMLFMFNVFFPMYPMDGAKLIVCSLQLWCNASARCAAKVLVYTSVPLAVVFIGYSLMGLHGGGLQPGITAYMGLMCLMESYKIYQLMKEERLHTHPLFELARSQTRPVSDGYGNSVRLNQYDRDDEEMAVAAPQVTFTEMRPFGGEGRTLAGGQSSSPSQRALSEERPAKVGVPAAASAADRGGRSAWLDKVEKEQQQRAKTVRELEEERLEREGLTQARFQAFS